MTSGDDFDLRDFLPYLLNQAAEESSLAFQNVYKDRYGILRTEWRVLFHLSIYGGMTAREICTRTRMHKTKISRAVRKLEDRRYLTRQRDDSDRRLEQLELTQAGRAVYEDLHSVAAKYNADLVARLAPEDVPALQRALRKLAGING